jgi:short-subunit dehydrogenase
MLTGKVVLITGASSGIGAALAHRLAAEGASLALAARREQNLEEVAANIRRDHDRTEVLVIRCDVEKREQAEDSVLNACKHFGRLDILVNNAGRGHFAQIEDTTDAVIRSMFEVNVYPLWYTTRPALRQMKKQGSGHIINIASMAGKVGFPFNSAYVAAKHAVVGFTRALRLELAESGIHATVVCPAGVTTDWASTTEGAPIRELFSAAGPIIRKISEERALPLPSVEGVLSPETVADRIVECMYHPVAEVYTHRGAREFALLAAQNPEEAERRQLPVVLGEREAYRRLHLAGR